MLTAAALPDNKSDLLIKNHQFDREQTGGCLGPMKKTGGMTAGLGDSWVMDGGHLDGDSPRSTGTCLTSGHVLGTHAASGQPVTPPGVEDSPTHCPGAQACSLLPHNK